MWVRGLKHPQYRKNFVQVSSHPMWVRGLKLGRRLIFLIVKVAPYVGAWIETRLRRSQFAYSLSHPMWVRGLKQLTTLIICHQLIVAPYVGAWIETKKEY